MRYADILFIDDDADDLDLYVSAIHALPAPVTAHTSNDAVSALKKLDAGEMKPDLIFLDLNMPAMNGWDFLLAVKAKPSLKNIPVIILSTTAQTETVRETKALGAVDYIVKPVSYFELKSIFRNLLTP